MARPPNLRASDGDRERVAEALRDAHAEGRLDGDEFLERLDAVYRARTFGDLDDLVADLPARGTPAVRAPDADRPPGASTPARQGGAGGVVDTALRASWAAWGIAVSVNLVVWFLVGVGSEGEFPYFWPMWVAGPWGALLLAATLARRASR